MLVNLKVFDIVSALQNRRILLPAQKLIRKNILSMETERGKLATLYGELAVGYPQYMVVQSGCGHGNRPEVTSRALHTLYEDIVEVGGVEALKEANYAIVGKPGDGGTAADIHQRLVGLSECYLEESNNSID